MTKVVVSKEKVNLVLGRGTCGGGGEQVTKVVASKEKIDPEFARGGEGVCYMYISLA